MKSMEQFNNDRVLPEKYINMFSELKIDRKIRLFVYGLSGSGKDTISNYLRDTFGFVKLRLASTIKQSICETEELTYSELEERKRNEKHFRVAHHKWSDIVRGETNRDSIYSLNRLYNLLTCNSVEFDMSPSLAGKNQVVCDVRTYQEAMALLHAGAKGIFLSRTVNNEYINETHFTEEKLLWDTELMGEILKFKNQLILINNPVENNEQFESLIPLDFNWVITCVNSTAEDLRNVMYDVINSGDIVNL